MPAAVKFNPAIGGLKDEVLPDQRWKFSAAEHHVAPGQHRVKPAGTQLGGDGVKGVIDQFLLTLLGRLFIGQSLM